MAAPVIAKCPEEKEMLTGIEKNLYVEVIPNGADLSGLLPQMTKPAKGPLKLICVARLIERKGQHHLIQAVKQLSTVGVDVTLDLVGTGDSLKEYQQLTRDLKVEDRVNFTGYVPREEIGRCYQAADVFVLPSDNEGMSLAALEAMAAGLPLLLTRTGGTTDLVEDGVNGYVFDWADVDSLALHIQSIAENRALLKKMGDASRKRAERYSWPCIAEQFLRIFNKPPAYPASRKV
jgi:phosphatidyl-myo-inositol dimannoside synthase